jgi:YidC/Oxa1 family membrane protein insertase
MMEKHQKDESEKQKQMKQVKDNIKAVFSGDKKYMLLSTLYRQHNYHPVYALRSSLSLIIQIPFFIAAYRFLSNLEMINGVSFGPVKDLGQPDMLIKIKYNPVMAYGINVLPFVMTLINLISSFIYTKGSSIREKIKQYGMAALFLILLINTPSALALYWTANNLISLVKNIILKTKQPKQAAHILVSGLCIFLCVYLVFIHDGWIVKRAFLAFFFAIIPFLPFLLRRLPEKFPKIFAPQVEQGSAGNTVIFILSMVTLFLLAGLVVPSALIGSSVQDFSFIGNYKSPFPFIGHTAVKAFGIFIIWPALIYFLFSVKIKNILTQLAVFISIAVLINVFVFPSSYIPLSIDFTFREDIQAGVAAKTINIFALAASIAVGLFLFSRFKKIVHFALTAAVCALLAAASISSILIHKEFVSFKLLFEKNERFADDAVYQFSKEGKNVLFIFLDTALSGYVPYIFEEKQELYSSFDGFAWYRNTISFGGHTVFCEAPMLGGYEYTPLEINARSDVSRGQKRNEALLMLPKIFLDQGYKVTVSDWGWSNLSRFDAYPGIHAENIIGRYTKNWLAKSSQNELIIVTNEAEKIKLNMIRFSFFRAAPLLFRNFVYDNGRWLNIGETKNEKTYTYELVSNYSTLDVLDRITEIKDGEFNTYTGMVNYLTHDPTFLQAPDYVPVKKVTDRGNSPYAHEATYHVAIAALLLLGKWFDFLKENDVYDNTRIIIVSDHGAGANIQDYIDLPNGDMLEQYAALLLVKDFNSHGRLTVDNSFMTNADAPLIALEDIVKNPVNPWTGKVLKSVKEDGITLTTSHNPFFGLHPKNTLSIAHDQWLHVHTDIFDSENWSQVTQK